jgi:uncharacterized protein (DUF1800 family)
MVADKQISSQPEGAGQMSISNADPALGQPLFTPPIPIFFFHDERLIN